ncbi:hypothetical protein L207DRAFT_520615 [Hyaloscypha variabilis F]|uniref:Uncharacterized protein n=1 Tax=Hyaloscypha variabilis (strain UAMH 11265 / GT02V1 / F) TaxID=1149755 RepID=A0A2J6QUQ2_HYAVF|nr:hypothetical protein L207DRAFT_520615 [Hyaloscypha variabilis F]
MATEATSEPIATSSISPDHELNPTETASQDVLPEAHLVNGSADRDELKPDTENVESFVNSAEVSVSGGSDTEASKAETSKIAGDEKGHVRTASAVRKPTSFKPVSVNKTFLAAKGATPAAPSKLGDKAATAAATQPGALSTAARPRLVAKSGSGLRDSAPRTSTAANGGKPGTAPDASAVWNKNRPAPPPEPKRFTDEELKQRYGIHLATRLQSDDPGKQANWADIDDDDDDWAPESIEWTDGTKITLPQADEAPAPSPEPVPATLKEAKALETTKPRSPAPTQASASPTVKPSGFGGRAGLVLKGASEKPTLVAKPPGPPTPVKSPWAPLPPVDKVAPIAIDIPQNQQQQSRFNQRDPHGFHGMPPPPAKEIAADDFSRSWREGANTSRELYNSQSGRYEPVNDNRRGSMRNDARGPQPAVLQRPSQGDGPAEPSAAFQTHRASGQDGAYGRRRTSSNVSGGSGNFVRRMSRGHEMPPPHEMLNVRRGSLAAVSDAPSSPRNYSPSGQNFPGQAGQRGHQNQQWQSRASPVISHPSPQSMHGQMVPPSSASADNQSQPTSAVYEDPLEVQKKIMRQTRELAIKRRQEEEAKEEAARKERIRIKLEAMGPPPETKKKSSPQEAKVTPTQIQTRESTDAVPGQGEAAATESGAAPKATTDATSQPPVTDSLDGKTDEKPSPSEENRTNGIHQKQSQSAIPPVSQDNRSLQQDSRSSRDDSRPPQSWQADPASASDRFKPWAPAPSQQSSSRSVWGPPTNDRTLGNGTFNPELSRVPDMHQPMRPNPIGPPNSNRNGQFQQGRGSEPYSARPAPIGPPNRQPVTSNQQDARQAAVAKSGWGSLPDRLAEEDAALYRQQELEDAKKRELEAQGMAPEVRGPVIKDTWRQVSINEDGTRSKVQASHTAVHGKNQEEATTRGMFEEQNTAPPSYLESVGNQQPFNDAWRSASNINAPPPARGSRFFPNRDVRLEEQTFDRPFERPGSPSPPPPTMDGHPAYDGDSARPHVSLPRPAPVVKLPPPTVLAPIGPPKPASFAAAVHSPSVQPPVHHNTGYGGHQNYTHQYQDVRRQEPAPANWQDRINSLIGRKNSPPKSHAFAVDSASKNALELPHQQYSATVSLPSRGLESTDDGLVETKPAAEECFEEQEMGSLPVIKVPNSAPASAWHMAPAPKPLPRKFIISEVTSIESLQFPQQISNNSTSLHIKIPGQDYTTTVSMAVARQRSNPRNRGGSRGGTPRSGSSSHPRGGRGRDASSGFPSPGLDNASVSSSPNSSGRGNRGGRGGYGTNWNRHVSTPVHT